MSEAQGIGILCSWYVSRSEPRSFTLLEESEHSYIPSTSYLCTIKASVGCFEDLGRDNISSPSILHSHPEDSAKIALITAKSFKLTSEVYGHINYLKGTKLIADRVTCQSKVMSKSEKGTTSHWIKHRNISLSRKHKLQILNGHELCDMHVNAFQNLVKGLFPHVGGLQNTLLQSKYSITNQPGKPVLQIVHIRNCHWATLYVDNDDIRLYDSAYSSLSEDTFAVIAQLIRFSGKSFDIKIMNIAKQSGSVDCALYSMAILHHLALGCDPTELVYNQPDLRPHLTRCLESSTLTLKHRKPSNSVSRVEKCIVYCYCRMPDDHTKMVQCDEWHHIHCVADYVQGESWFCSKCATMKTH